MGNFLHRATKQYLVSADPNGLPEPLANYINGPDLSAVAGFSSQYWVITGDVVTLMSVAERDAVDAQALDDSRDSSVNELDGLESLMRAFALVVLDEFNTLRAQHLLAPRTIGNLKTAIRNKLGS